MFEVTSIRLEGKRIVYDYNVTGEWNKYFNNSIKFWVEYSEDISGIPLGLAAVPLVSNVIALASIFDAKIVLPIIDKNFYDSIPRFMNGFARMYPSLSFNYKDVILCDNIEESAYGTDSDEADTMAFFSGGVDAYTTLIRHEKEKMILFTVCGADIWYCNQAGFSEILRKNREIAELHNLRIVSCVSTLRKFVNNEEIYSYIYPIIGDNFWHGLQHGLGMFGLSAGYAYLFDLKRIYFASSYSAQDDIKATCGSDPSIDNFVRIGKAQICHDGFELSRQNKVSELCHYSSTHHKKIRLRVCYRSGKGENCCECEKCTRTIMSILAEGYDPRDFGFEAYKEEELYGNLLATLKELSNKPKVVTPCYDAMKKRYAETHSEEEVPDEMKIFVKSELPDVLAMLNAIRTQENKLYISDLENRKEKVYYKEDYFRNYFKNRPAIYSEICSDIINTSKERKVQKVDYWIGNHGFALNKSEGIDISGQVITISKQSKDITLEGWAADFVNDKPLADLIVKVGDTFYSLNYGKKNINLGKRFENDLLAYIEYKASFPLSVFQTTDLNEISFYMIGFDGNEIYRYPAVKYRVEMK